MRLEINETFTAHATLIKPLLTRELRSQAHSSAGASIALTSVGLDILLRYRK